MIVNPPALQKSWISAELIVDARYNTSGSSLFSRAFLSTFRHVNEILSQTNVAMVS